MLRHKIYYFAFSFLLLACAKSNDGARCQLDGNCDGSDQVVTQGAPVTLEGSISCVAQSTKSVYAHNETVGITITASGGTGTYAVPSFVSSFSGSTTIYIGAYKNNGTTDRAVEKAVSITDSAGRLTSCNFRFTVSPVVGTTGLSCGLTASKYNPMVGDLVNFTVKASGGVAPYTFGQFYPRQGETPKNLASSNSTTGDGVVAHAYGWIGYVDPAVKVTDASGASLWCEIPGRYTQVVAKTPPKVWASQTSGTVDAEGNATDSKDLFLVNLSVSGFSGTSPVEYSYVGSQTGVTISQNLNWLGSSVFFIKRTDTLTKDFNIIFTAKTADNTQSANVTVNIKFGTYLACDVEEPAFLYHGVEGLFKVTSFNGEAVEIAEVVNPSGVTVRKATSGNSAHLGLTFNAQGFYEVRFKAKSRVDALKYCNGKSEYLVQAYVLPAPSTLTGCEVKPNVTSVNQYSPLRVDVVRKGGGTDLNGYVVALTPNGASSWIAGPYNNGPDTTSYDLSLSVQKTYTLAATVREVSTGKLVSCQSQVVVSTEPGLLAKVYWLPNHKTDVMSRYPNFSALDFRYQFVVPNIHVTARRSDCNDHRWSHRNKYGFAAECEYPGVYGRKEWFAVEYTGKIVAPTAGTYNFRFTVDDGIALEIDGSSVLVFDGLHAPQTTPVAAKYLSAGEHTVRIRYFQGPKWEVANTFFWQKPGGAWEVVPATSLRQP